ncbi:N-acetyltransferase family protein [Melissospora conviva]|uniref:GNAT family N-acetyltransferase n=1 Tax=Melissospora conviva TaxID=3388432 RepID=UPI003C1D1CD4
MTLVLRPVCRDDLMAVGAVHHASRIDTYRGFVDPAALESVPAEALGRWWYERWPYERDTHRLTVAERNGRIVGFTYLGPDEYGEPGLGELYAIHLVPAEEGRGTGRALMVDALAALHERGFTRASLWVVAGNQHARRFYERGGWRPDGTERESAIAAAITRQLRYLRSLP